MLTEHASWSFSASNMVVQTDTWSCEQSPISYCCIVMTTWPVCGVKSSSTRERISPVFPNRLLQPTCRFIVLCRGVITPLWVCFLWSQPQRKSPFCCIFLFGSFKFTLPNYQWTGACEPKSDGLTSSLFIGQSFGNLSFCKITDFGNQKAERIKTNLIPVPLGSTEFVVFSVVFAIISISAQHTR